MYLFLSSFCFQNSNLRNDEQTNLSGQDAVSDNYVENVSWKKSDLTMIESEDVAANINVGSGDTAWLANNGSPKISGSPPPLNLDEYSI